MLNDMSFFCCQQGDHKDTGYSGQSHHFLSCQMGETPSVNHSLIIMEALGPINSNDYFISCFWKQIAAL